MGTKRVVNLATLKGNASWAPLLIICCVFSSLYFLAKQSIGQVSVSLLSDRIAKVATNTNSDVDADEKLSEFISTDNNFVGAREWYDHWTYASKKGKSSIGSINNPSHIHDEYLTSEVESISEATLQHINDMRERYESVDALPDFYARGIGWIQDRLGMVLTVVTVGKSAGDNGNTTTLHSGPTSIFIVDVAGGVKCGGEGETWIDKQPPLTMWVRANGPEIFAGTALPHPWDSHRCAWRYDFEPKTAGVYSIHVKVLTFDGFQDFDTAECHAENLESRNDQFDRQEANTTGGQAYIEELEAMNYDAVRELAEQGNYSHHRGVSGFKVYGHREACCEACTKARNCKMWSSPGSRHLDNCELYFDRIEDDVDFLDRESGHYLGRNSSYSFMRQTPSDFPNIRRKLSHRELAVSSDEIKKPWPIAEHPLKGSSRAGAFTYFIGCGWSNYMTFEHPCHYPSDDLVFGSGKKISIVTDVNEAVTKVSQSCTVDDEKLDTSHGRWVRHPFPDDSVCLEMVNDNNSAKFRNFRPMYHGNRDPSCWHRHDLTKVATTCAEPGCQFVINHRWMTDLKREAKWFGMWEPYRCTYHDMGDDLIQQCIDKKNISSIKLQGASISNMVDSYMTQKLQMINMTSAANGTLSVVFDTLKMPHKLWHLSIEEWRKELNDFPDVTASEIEYYWLTGFYFTSEREPHVTLDRSLQYSKMAWDILSGKGYKMINGFDVTAAFAFDTDAQADGLHITGPPIHAIITKFFHHLCHNDLSLKP